MQSNDFSATRGRWLTLLLSPVSWMVYFVLVYLLDEAACAIDILEAPIFNHGALLVPMLIVLTLATLAILVYGGHLGWRLVREAKAQSTARGMVSSQDDAQNGSGEYEAVMARDYFIGMSGIILSVLFAIFTVGMLIVIVGVRPC